jgi:hypothetical protein
VIKLKADNAVLRSNSPAKIQIKRETPATFREKMQKLQIWKVVLPILQSQPLGTCPLDLSMHQMRDFYVKNHKSQSGKIRA